MFKKTESVVLWWNPEVHVINKLQVVNIARNILEEDTFILVCNPRVLIKF